MKIYFYIALALSWVVIMVFPLFQKKEGSTRKKSSSVSSKYSENRSHVWKQYISSPDQIELENVKINLTLNTPKNVEIINTGTKQQRLTLAWSKNEKDDLSGGYMKYKIYRKVGLKGDYSLLHTEGSINYNQKLKKYTFSDYIVDVNETVSQWIPLTFYSYTVSTALKADESESALSSIVTGFLVPDKPINALKDIWKTLEIANSNTNGFSALGGSSEYKIGEVSGYFKRTHRSTKKSTNAAIWYSYEYNQFSEFGSITVDGILEGSIPFEDNSMVNINGELKITGNYEASVHFVNFAVSTLSGYATQGYFYIDYNHQRKEVNADNQIFDTLINERKLQA